jgi:hypothetical protein
MTEAFHTLLHFLGRLGWAWGLAISVVVGAGSLALAAFVAVRWPSDQFKRATPPPFLAGHAPLVRWLGIAAKNLGGTLLILLGIVMALPGVPGQGFLTILIGLTLVDFPGKRRLERKLVQRPAVLRGINQLRTRFGRPVLDID